MEKVMNLTRLKKYTEKVKPPRSIFLRWPFGHPLGEPFNVLQQRAVLIEAFSALYSIREPGMIYDVPFRWKRENYKERKSMMPQL
jgi:D-proline reductase (dithiol) PrdB